jgi:HNH endonuclease/Homeodomain-like domain
MKTDTCVACGVRDALHHHHLTPRIEGGSDDDTNLITLCEDCHGRIHGVTFKDHRKLHAISMDKARAEGKMKGRDPRARRHATAIHELAALDWTRKRIAEVGQISERSVYRVLSSEPPAPPEPSEPIRSLLIPMPDLPIDP